MTKVGEDAQFKANLGFAAKVIAFVGVAVWTYATIEKRISNIEMELHRMNTELKQNSEFRVKWPRGELGSLPDDAEQNMRLDFMERRMDKMGLVVEEMRFAE
tara:strand:+ start:980 stop:1285 length:306 start_codon:yes stop_codon:yes gene_type:complete